jgi:hypothetical protein
VATVKKAVVAMPTVVVVNNKSMAVLTTTITKATTDRATTNTTIAWMVTTNRAIIPTTTHSTLASRTANSTTINTRGSTMIGGIIMMATAEEVEVVLFQVTELDINTSNLIIKTTPRIPSTITITIILKTSSRGLEESLHSTTRIARTRAIVRDRMCLCSRMDNLSLMIGQGLRETMVTGRITINRISNIMRRIITTMDIMADIKRNT